MPRLPFQQKFHVNQKQIKRDADAIVQWSFVLKRFVMFCFKYAQNWSVTIANRIEKSELQMSNSTTMPEQTDTIPTVLPCHQCNDHRILMIHGASNRSSSLSWSYELKWSYLCFEGLIRVQIDHLVHSTSVTENSKQQKYIKASFHGSTRRSCWATARVLKDLLFIFVCL